MGDNNAGIWINEGSFNCTIEGNIITNNAEGIQTFESVDSATGLGQPADILISDNYITNNNEEYGIYCATPNTTISGNTITHNGWDGLIIDSATNVTISFNTINDNGVNAGGAPETAGGLYLRWYGPFFIYGNNMSDNQGYGIEFGEGCNNSTVFDNNIVDNSVGVNMLNFVLGGSATIGLGNIVYQNNFIDNDQQVFVEKTNPVASGDATLRNGTDTVTWDNDKEGNYWSDYLTRYPKATEVDSRRIGNTPYVIDSNNVDDYPLMQRADISAATPASTPSSSTSSTPAPSIPEFPSWIILPLSIMTVVAAIFVRRKKPREQS